MTDPIDRFCRMLSHPELGDANELTGLCCSFLGVEEAFGGKMSPKTQWMTCEPRCVILSIELACEPTY